VKQLQIVKIFYLHHLHLTCEIRNRHNVRIKRVDGFKYIQLSCDVNFTMLSFRIFVSSTIRSRISNGISDCMRLSMSIRCSMNIFHVLSDREIQLPRLSEMYTTVHTGSTLMPTSITYTM